MKNQLSKLEIEFRARFSQKKFEALKDFLDKNAECLGENNKDCYYYVFPDKLLKLVNNVSKKTAKISLKLNHIGSGAAFPEIEVYFPPQQFNTAKQLIDSLDLPAKVIYGPQQRVDYRYKNCEIALKYSDAWGYHLEIEQVIKTKKEQPKAEKAIREVADELGVKLMSEEELKKFTQNAEKQV